MGDNYTRDLEKLMEERKESYCQVGIYWSDKNDPMPRLQFLLLQTLQPTLLVDLIYMNEYS